MSLAAQIAVDIATRGTPPNLALKKSLCNASLCFVGPVSILSNTMGTHACARYKPDSLIADF